MLSYALTHGALTWSAIARVHHIGTGPNADHRSLPPILQLPGLNSVWSASAQRHNYFPGLYGGPSRRMSAS